MILRQVVILGNGLEPEMLSFLGLILERIFHMLGHPYNRDTHITGISVFIQLPEAEARHRA